MIGRLGWIVALWAALCGQGHGTTLVYTSPCNLMHVWRAFDEVLGDSVTNRDCGPGGVAAKEQIRVYLWKRAIGPNQAYVRIDSHLVAPCREDSFPGQGAGHYYLSARNSAGESCASWQVTLMPGVLTSVELEEIQAPVVSCSLYDVHGRRVAVLPGAVWYECVRRGLVMDGALLGRGVTAGRVAAGVYWLRGVTRDRAVRVRRVVVVR